MKGRTRTAAEKHLHDRLANEVGCIACRKNGIRNMVVSIHHIDGRTKPGAHSRVLPLCAGHHQDGTGAPGLIAVHPWKRRFEDKYGGQYDLLEDCLEILAEREVLA
ncbi:hypothetical protein D3C84_569330 [compost metagenome]